MRTISAVVALLLISMVLVSCGGYTTGTVQTVEKGFLKFVGNPEGVMISVDNGTPFEYNPDVELYSLAPGNHAVKVTRENQVVVDRTIFLDNRATMEIEVP